MPSKKNPSAVELGRLGGRKGGPARAKKMTAKERSDAARKAARVRWNLCSICGKEMVDNQHLCLGARGGQAGRTNHAEVSPSVRPVDAPGPTNAGSGAPHRSGTRNPEVVGGVSPGSIPSASDLHRYFCELYCPKHGFVTASQVPSCVCDGIVPGLHTRDPRTKVEWMRRSGNGYWVLSDDRSPPIYSRISDAHAADLLVMRLIRVAWDDNDLFDLIAEVSEIQGKNPDVSFTEAVAIAKHRMLDAEEQG